MAYITPNSTVILCKNVPLDNTYEHTIYFTDPGSQATYFQGKAITTLNNQTYCRVERGKLRVQVVADTIYTCNYMMFKNTAYGTKWFYAFITGVEYVNDVTSEITFEIDSLQTYWFDTTLLKCFVEREHTRTDEVGDNLVPEPIDVPDLIPQQKYSRYWSINDFKLVIQIKPTAIGNALENNATIITKELNQVVPMSQTFDFATPQDIDNINSWIKTADFKNFEITNAYLVPSEFFGSAYHAPDLDIYNHNMVRPTSYRNADGNSVYQPDNNKLFTYPYTKLLVTSPLGSSEEYLWELSRDDGRIHLTLFTNPTNTPSCEIRAEQYAGAGYSNTWDRFTRLNTVSIDSFPEVQISQFFGYSLPNLIHAGTHIGNIIASSTQYNTKNAKARAITDAIDTATDMMFERASKSCGTSDSNLDLRYGTFGFTFYVMGIKGEDAKIIDDFFTKYGYAVQSLKVPNINVRPHWTYTKTKGCVVRANAPADDVRKICQIFDQGITFWNNGNEVGDYSLDNRVPSENP